MLTKKTLNSIRLMAFKAMLRQECGWFDRKENSVGFLSSNLSGDAANVQNVRFSAFLNSVEAENELLEIKFNTN